MKLFKGIDEKFKEIGFEKVSESKYGVSYERETKKYNFVQVLDIVHKGSGQHLIQSYQKGINKDNYNNAVGLTAYETKLALRKMKKIGLA